MHRNNFMTFDLVVGASNENAATGSSGMLPRWKRQF